MIEVDKSHKKIDLRNIDIKKAKELGIKIGATALTLFVLSGCGKKEVKKNVDENEIIPTTTQEIVVEGGYGK